MTASSVARIGDFCRTGSGSTPSRGQLERFYDGGSIPWVKSGELRERLILGTEEHITEAALNETSVKLVPAGAILLAMYGATVGRLAILGVKATTNQAICHILPDAAVADTQYLFRAIAAKVPQIISMGVGGAQPNISQSLVKDLQVLLPPLPEQRRIAAILDQADALRAKRREALAQLDSLTQSIFIEMFGDPATNPKSWPEAALSKLVREDDTINYGVVQPGDALEEGIPLVRVGDLVDGNFSDKTVKRIDPTIESAYKRSRLQGDEILVSCVGSIGVTVLATPAMKGFNIARAVARIPLAEGVNRIFVASFLKTDAVQNYFTSEVRTVAQPTLNIKQIAETKVFCPPLALQQTFATRIQAVEHLKTTHRAALAELDALFASLQHRAFAGQFS